MRKLNIGFFCLQAMLWHQGLFAQEEDMPMRDHGFWQTILMVAIAILFFYFILWRPEQKKRQALEKQRSNLNKGDKVTAMGIIGTVLRVQDQTVILKMYDGAKIEVLTGAITDVASSASTPQTEEEKNE